MSAKRGAPNKETPKSKSIIIRMEETLYDKLKKRAGKTPVSTFCREKLEAIVD